MQETTTIMEACLNLHQGFLSPWEHWNVEHLQLEQDSQGELECVTEIVCGMQDYVKWRGPLFHRFLLALVDDSRSVCALAEYLLTDTLASKVHCAVCPAMCLRLSLGHSAITLALLAGCC